MPMDNDNQDPVVQPVEPDGGLYVRSGRRYRLILSTHRLLYADPGLPEVPVPGGELQVLDPDGSVARQVSVLPDGRCESPLGAPGDHLRVVLLDDPDYTPEEVEELRRYCVQEVTVGAEIRVESPLSYELWWEGPHSEDASGTGGGREHPVGARLTLRALDGSYTAQRAIPVGAAEPIAVRFFGVRPGTRYTLAWQADGEEVPLMEDSDLGLHHP